MELTFKNAELFRKWAYFQGNLDKKEIEEVANGIELEKYEGVCITCNYANNEVLKSPIPNSVNK